jgi:hypothetical protein
VEGEPAGPLPAGSSDDRRAFSYDERTTAKETTTMEKKTIRIELTDEQKRKLKEQTGKDAKAVELTAEELEERVSPARFNV